MRRSLALFLAGTTALLAACGGGDSTSTPVTPPPSPTIAIALAPTSITASRGATVTTTVTLTRGGNYAGAVALAAEGVPSGVQVTIAPTSLTGATTTATATIVVGGTAAIGATSFTITASGSGVSSSSASFALTVPTPPGVTVSAVGAQQLSQGTSSATPIPLVFTRTGGLAGDLALTLEGAPAGVTATFTPNPVTGAGSQMTLNASATAAPGSYPLTVRATGAGGVTGTATFTLTVTAAAIGTIAINTVPASLTVVQGQTGLATVNIARGGGFTGAVTLSASGLPNGATATFTPSVAAGAQAQLGIVVANSTPAGSYTVTVRGQGAGVSDATTTLAFTVTPSTNSGNVNWTFCESSRFPAWFAVQSGVNGAWTAVTPTGTTTRVYNFSSSPVNGVAYAIPRLGGGTDVYVNYLTASEVGIQAQNECTFNRRTRTLTGTVAGVPLGAQAFVSTGGAGTAVVSPTTSFTLTGVAEGLSDLVASRSSPGPGNVGFIADRAILRRNVTYASGSSIPLLDFASSESFPLVSANYAVLNAGGDQIAMTTTFITGNGAAGPLTTTSQPVAIATQRVYGIPAANLVSGDQHQVQVLAVNSSGGTTSTRYLVQFNRELVDRTVTLGPVFPTLVPSTIGTAPYRRFTVSGLWQADYGDAVSVSYLQQPVLQNSWTITMSRGYSGAGTNTWTLTMPDLSGVAGFDVGWGLGSAPTFYTYLSSGGTLGGTTSGAGNIGFGEGGSYRLASRVGSFTP